MLINHRPILLLLNIIFLSPIPIREYTQAGCTDASGAVSSIYMGCGVCINYNTYLAGSSNSVIYACGTGTIINGVNYNTANCAGTPSCFSANAQTCGSAPTTLQPQGPSINHTTYNYPHYLQLHTILITIPYL